MFLPLALIACGGEEKTNEGENETLEITPEPIEEAAPEVMYTPDTSAEQLIVDYLKANKWTGERHESGMYIVVENAGEPEKPTLLDDVTIFYTGKLLDGTVFDGTTTEPATFPLSNLIPGWQIGIPYFGEGGKGKLVIPPGLAYGEYGSGEAVPPNATLMFEIELVTFKKSAKKPMYY